MGGVDVALPTSREAGFTVGHQIDATLDIQSPDNILQVGRPTHGTPNASASVFKIVDGGKAEQVVVKFGRFSVNMIEVLEGLKEGDKIILSDASNVDNADRIDLHRPNAPVQPLSYRVGVELRP